MRTQLGHACGWPQRVLRRDRRDVQMSGKADEMKGKIKKAAGDITGDKDLEREGRVQEGAGKIKKAVDKVADKATGKA
jgi:uncharacterized protein YjbJ (UPF0337 family)